MLCAYILRCDDSMHTRSVSDESDTQTAVSQEPSLRRLVPLSWQMSVVPGESNVPGAQGRGGGPV